MSKFSIALAGVLAVRGMADEFSLQQGNRATPEDAKTVEGRFKGMEKMGAAGVDSFGFEIALEASNKEEYLMNWQQVLLTVRATKTVSSEVGYSAVETMQMIQPGLINVTATKLQHISDNVWPRRMVPEKFFQIRLETLRFPIDRPIYVCLRFRDVEEYFALTFRPGQGVRLVGVRNSVGTAKVDSIKDFAILEAAESQRIYRCDNFQIVSHEGDKVLWTRRIPLEGVPKEIRIVGETLFLLSTQGHSLYVRKNDGKIIMYHNRLLAGKSPWDEILKVVCDDYARRGPQKAELYKAMFAAALLGEKRAAPFLIECLEKGSGLTERWLAVVVLEHLNGNSTYWKAAGEGQPWDPTVRSNEWDMGRVYPDSAIKAEVQKWESVFGKVNVPVLKGPKE